MNKWLEKLKHAKGIIVAIAGGGAVLSGLVGYYTTYQTVASGVSTAPSATASVANIRPLSVVVLPFANQTGDAQKGYIADGLTTSITSDLLRIRDAFVISSATAFTYRDKPVTAQQVGKEVGVRFVLQGSVLASSDKMRINAQLADTQTGAQLWSETFEGALTNLFALQDQVTTKIANSIGREMVVVAARESEKRSANNPKVADLMLRLDALSLKPISPSNLPLVDEVCRQILAIEPNQVNAMLALARMEIFSLLYFSGMFDEQTQAKKYKEVGEMLLKAKQIDPDNVNAHIPTMLYAESQGDFDGALRAVEQGFARLPKDPVIYNSLAHTLLMRGESKKALEILNQALVLDPLHPRARDLIPFNLGWGYFMAGDNDASIKWFLTTLEKTPSYVDAYAFLAMAYTLKGNEAKAQAALADLKRVDPKSFYAIHRTPKPTSPQAFKDYYAKKYLPAARKIGLTIPDGQK
jgi:adenylate cyclase